MQRGAQEGTATASAADPSLDFTSSRFDPLKVLHTDPSILQLPYPNVQPCDNLDAYESGQCTHILHRCLHVSGQLVHTHTLLLVRPYTTRAPLPFERSVQSDEVYTTTQINWLISAQCVHYISGCGHSLE